MTEMVSISKEEYVELLNLKKVVENFEKELHLRDIYYGVASKVSSEVSSGNMKILDESEVL